MRGTDRSKIGGIKQREYLDIISYLRPTITEAVQAKCKTTTIDFDKQLLFASLD